uniref:Uncharacterized protein n=1 Tax=Loa loa TaxID=7209 RepID=A0A1I7V7U2_LOALO
MANMLTFNFCIICITADNYDYLESNIEIDKLNGLKSKKYSNQSIQHAIMILLTNRSQSTNQQHKQSDNISLQRLNSVAASSFDPLTSGLWAQHASTAPRCSNVKYLNIDILTVHSNSTILYRQRYLRKAADYKYTSREQSILFAAIAVGALLAILPVTFSIQHYGTR